MPLINTSVPNLIQGVSQQADASRFAGQCEEQENALSSVAEGLKKRPNTRHIARLLMKAIDNNSFVHFINRSDAEKYVIIHDGTHLYAFNTITGVEAEIKVGTNCYKASWTAAEVTTHNNATPANSTTYVSTGYPVSGSYLNSSQARKDLKALTVGDSTFIVNATQTVANGQDFTANSENEALVFIKQGAYDKNYSLKVRGTGANGIGQSARLLTNGIQHTHYSDPNYKLTGASVVSNERGSGFSVGDILPVNVRQSFNIQLEDDDGDVYRTLYYNYVEYTQPTVRVTAVQGTNNELATVAVANAGSFSWVNQFGGKPAMYAGNPYVSSWTNSVYSNIESNSISSNDIVASSNSAVSSGNTAITINAALTSGSTSASIDTTAISRTLAKFGTTVASSTERATWAANFVKTGTGGNQTNYHEGNLIVIEANSNVQQLTVTGKDGLAGTGVGVVSREVSSISDLPLYAKKGHKVKIIGDAELQQDDYYVSFHTASGETYGQGSWVEDVAPNLRLGYNPTTVPMELINSAENAFELRHMKIADRTVGDDNTNPLASFISHPIDNVFFFKNRLGFLCQENVIMGESGLGVPDETGQMVYNFNRTTVTTLLDSDPIDISVSSSRVTNLKAAKGFQENLMLFADNGQFVLKGADVLTPRTVSVAPVTNFNFEGEVDPLPLGSYLYFPFTRGKFTGLREYSVNASNDTYDAAEVTEHIPAYIPHNIIDMAGTTSEDVIAILSSDEKDTLYIYNYFWNNNQKVLSAWSKFTFNGEIRGIEFIESTLYMVMTDNQSNTHLVSLPFEAGLKDLDHTGTPAGFLTLLDRRVRAKVASGTDVIQFEKTDGTYSSLHADLPYTFYNGDIPTGGQPLSELFVDSTGTTHTLKYQTSGSNGNIPLISAGNASTDLYGYVGVPYTMKYKFSTQVFKASAGKSASPTNASAMHVRNGTVFFDDTRTFDVKVTPENRTTATNTFLADDIPEAEEAIAEEYPLAVGTHTYARGTIFTRTSESAFTMVVSDTNVNNASGGGTNYDYPYFATRPATVGKYRMTFDLELITGSLDAIDVIWSDADNIPSNGITYNGYIEPTVGSNVIEMEIFDDGLTGGNEPPPQIMWRVMTDSLLNVSITNFKIERLSNVKFAEGNFRFPVYSKAKHTNVFIENSSPFDSKFSSAEFESFVHPRSTRYG